MTLENLTGAFFQIIDVDQIPYSYTQSESYKFLISADTEESLSLALLGAKFVSKVGYIPDLEVIICYYFITFFLLLSSPFVSLS